MWEDCRKACAELLRKKLPGLGDVTINLAIHERPAERIGEIGLTAKSVIAVGSGKGGVGKSTIAASLAFGLNKAGAKVGLMDADVYGPSIPHLLGVNRRPDMIEQKIQPIEVAGVKVMSMGFLVPAGEAVVWRGPMLHGAITQFLRDTAWGELDYLIIDMPPGTGDIARHALAAIAAHRRGRRLHAARRGAVGRGEGHRHVSQGEYPGAGHGREHELLSLPRLRQAVRHLRQRRREEKAVELDIPFLGEVPINIQIRVHGDEGRIAGNFSDETTSPYFKALYFNLVKNISAARREHPPLPSLSVLG